MKKRLGLLGIGLLIIVAGYGVFYKFSGAFKRSDNPMQYLPNMHRTEALIPMRGTDFFQDGASVRVPPKGSVARDQKYQPNKNVKSALDVARKSNPLSLNEGVLARGKIVYSNNCAICHGALGMGDGKIVPPFTKPPSLHSKKLRGFADSQLYHIVTFGQNVMRGYGTQVRENDRWATIYYVRALQKALNPRPSDIKAYKEYGNE